jgi:hypothetical protein
MEDPIRYVASTCSMLIGKHVLQPRVIGSRHIRRTTTCLTPPRGRPFLTLAESSRSHAILLCLQTIILSPCATKMVISRHHRPGHQLHQTLFLIGQDTSRRLHHPSSPRTTPDYQSYTIRQAMRLPNTSTARRRSFTAMAAALLAFPDKSVTPPTDRSAGMQFEVDISAFLTV